MAVGSGSAAFLVILVTSLLAASALAVTYNIPWNQQTNYVSTYGSTPFASGDVLVFTFGPTHSLLEVSSADAASCNSGSPINSYNSGDRITLAKDTSFICGTPGHCASGMSISIKLASSSTPTTPTTPSSPSTPTTPGTTTPTTPPSTPSTPEGNPGSGAPGLRSSAALLVASAAVVCPLLF